MRRVSFTCAAVSIILLLAFSGRVRADVLCHYQDSDVSNEGLELTKFKVKGAKDLIIDSKIDVSFTLSNVGKETIVFGSNGVFTAARDPEDIDSSFGHGYQQWILNPGKTIKFQAESTLDQAGLWSLWPGYQIKTIDGEKLGPDYWHACYLKVTDPSPTIVSIQQSPGKPVLGDLVSYFINAYDKDGIQWIQFWLDGEKRRTCAGSTCTFVTKGIDDPPLPGVIAMDGLGHIAVDGYAKHPWDPWDFEDTDGDGIINLTDNCWDVANPDQEDYDGDYVGNACDSCEIYLECGSYSENRLTNTCFDSREIRDYELEGRHYFDVYDVITVDGCGCLDTDGGRNLFEAGTVFTEKLSSRAISFMAEGQCNGTTSCSPMFFNPSTMDTESRIDRCIGNVLVEGGCSSEGPEEIWYDCPAGCDNGACVCPDTDGGEYYYVPGSVADQEDECLPDGRLREYTCEGIDASGTITVDHIDVDCPYGCEGGACLCRDSDGGINFEERGNIGPYEDRCFSDGRMISEVYAEVDTWGQCQVRHVAPAHVCEGRCDLGACQPPTCDDGILNQGEPFVDCGGPCPPCVNATLRGRIHYEEYDFSILNADGSTGASVGYKPFRFGNFKIIGWGDGMERRSWGPYTTDSTGYFNQEVPRTDDVSHYCILIGRWDVGSGSFNYASHVLKDMDYCEEYVWYVSHCIPADDLVDFGELKVSISGEDDNFWAFWQEPTGSCYWGVCWCGGPSYEDEGSSDYFSIANTVLTARQYADGHRSDVDTLPSVWIEFPESGIEEGASGDYCYWACSDERIRIREGRGYHDGTVAHEYGHFMQYTIGSWDYYGWGLLGMSHNFCTNNDEEFAWSEGFPSYFSSYLIETHADTLQGFFKLPCRLEGPYCSDTRCDSESWSWIGMCCDSFSENIEGAVQAVLWDLVDFEDPVLFPFSIPEDDELSGYDRRIFEIFDLELDDPFDEAIPADAPGLCDFVNVFCDDTGWWLEDKFQAVLDHYGASCVCSGR